MADDILYLPSAALAQKIDGIADANTSKLIELLIEHYETGTNRERLLRAFNAGRFSPKAQGEDILNLLNWAAGKSFELEGTARKAKSSISQPPTPSVVDERLREISEASFDLAEADFRLENTFRQLGAAERFPNFPPSWGLDTPLWEEVFGRHDPIPTIAFYLAGFFETEENSPPCFTIKLSQDDLPLWDQIVGNLSAIPWKVRYGEEEPDSLQKARALRTALGLPEDFGFALNLSDPDLAEIIRKSPDWMASRLIDWWSNEDIMWSRNHDERVAEEIPEQVGTIYRIMIRHLADWRRIGDDGLSDQFSVKLADVEDLPDYFPTDCRSYEKLIEAFWDAVDDWGDLHWYRTGLTKAVYLARDRVFRGRLPFKADSTLALAELNHEEGFWLADFSCTMERPRQTFRYLSLLTQEISSDQHLARLQLTEIARKRLAVYEMALEEIINDCPLELAKAWWAFFMASQSQMFSGLGLGVQESDRIIRTAKSLLPDEGIDKALTFVRIMAEDLDEPLERRVLLDLLPVPPDAQVFEMPSRSVDGFLAARISTAIWEQLHPDTRQDIRDAELLWEKSFRQVGAGRIDWGGPGVIYARAIERELKAHVLPKLGKLQEQGRISKRKTDTLGAIFKACEEAASAIASVPILDQDELDASIARLHQALKNDLRIVPSIRNRAAHGDKADPVAHFEFVELRAAILEREAFKLILIGDQP